MNKVCVSLGGALISGEDGFNVNYALSLASLIKREKDTEFIFVCGGGHNARSLIDAAKSAGVKNNIELDKIGIEATRLNALVIANVFEASGIEVAPVIPFTTDQFRAVMKQYRVVVCGGFVEGVTTDTDAVLAAEAAGCKLLLNVSKLSYVYDKDPKKFKDAKKQVSLSYAQLKKIADENDERMPRSNVIFDEIAAALVARSKIEVRFVDGNIKNFEMALHGKYHNGTTVKP